MSKPRIYADFHNADSLGRLRLNCAGTTDDLAKDRITLSEGLTLRLYSDDLDTSGHLDELEVDGIVAYSADEKCWVAIIDWNAIAHGSDDGVGAKQTVIPASTIRSGNQEVAVK